MLSLIELQNKKVEAKRKKYEKQEMDEYLEVVFDNYKQLLEENKRLVEEKKKVESEKVELNQKMKKLSDGIQYYRSIETTLQKALILAEKTSKETKDAAVLKAESIETDARKRADSIIQAAEGEYTKIKEKCVRLIQQFNQYKIQLKEAASAQLQLVEGDEFDIASPDQFKKDIENRDMAKEEPAPNKAVNPVNSGAVRHPVPRPKHQEPNKIVDTDKEDLLNADTIDLRNTLNTVQTEAEKTETASPAAGSATAASSVGTESATTASSAGTESATTASSMETAASAQAKDTTAAEKAVMAAATEKAKQESPVVPAPSASKPAPAEVQHATVIEPATVKTIQPTNVVFKEDTREAAETAAAVEAPELQNDLVTSGLEPIDHASAEDGLKLEVPEKKEDESLTLEAPEPSTGKTGDGIPTLDSLLQDLNLNNKNNQKSDDPFEFLGSIDDDF